MQGDLGTDSKDEGGDRLNIKEIARDRAHPRPVAVYRAVRDRHNGHDPGVDSAPAGPFPCSGAETDETRRAAEM